MKVISFNIKEQKDFIKEKEEKEKNEKEKEKKEKEQNLFYYVENGKKTTYHLIMAKEGTEAGNYYNNFTYQFLRHKFTNFTHRKNLSIIKEVKNKFVDWSRDLLEEKIESKNIEIVEENQIPKKYVFKPTEKAKQLIPRAIFSDELGFLVFRNSEYEPPYSYYIEDDKFLIIKLEIPGNVEFGEVYGSLDTKEIFISGKKICDDDSNKLLKTTRQFGKFNLLIPLPNQISISDENPIKEEIKEQEANSKNGIYIYKFELAKRRNKKIDNN